jgi:hypothetical protein
LIWRYGDQSNGAGKWVVLLGMAAFIDIDEGIICSGLEGNQNVPDTDWLQLLRLIVAPCDVRRQKKGSSRRLGEDGVD